jgi:hypothetical protein
MTHEFLIWKLRQIVLFTKNIEEKKVSVEEELKEHVNFMDMLISWYLLATLEKCCINNFIFKVKSQNPY